MENDRDLTWCKWCDHYSQKGTVNPYNNRLRKLKDVISYQVEISCYQVFCGIANIIKIKGYFIK